MENAMKVFRAEEILQCEELFGGIACREEQLEKEWQFREQGRQQRANSSSPAVGPVERNEDSTKKGESARQDAKTQLTVDSSTSTPSPDNSTAGESPRSSNRKAKNRQNQPRGESAAVLPVANGDSSSGKPESDTCPGCQKPVSDEDTESTLPSSDSSRLPDSSSVVLHSVCPVCGKERRKVSEHERLQADDKTTSQPSEPVVLVEPPQPSTDQAISAAPQEDATDTSMFSVSFSKTETPETEHGPKSQSSARKDISVSSIDR